MQIDNAKRRGTSAQGFTLIELMIVIAIIGVLLALVAPNVWKNLDKGNVRAAQAQISNFKTALIAYKIKFKKFPSSSEGLAALINNGKENFLDAPEVPVDPWNNAYQYTSPGTHGNDFEIVSYGRDGQPGGEEYDADITSWNLGASSAN